MRVDNAPTETFMAQIRNRASVSASMSVQRSLDCGGKQEGRAMTYRVTLTVTPFQRASELRRNISREPLKSKLVPVTAK